MRYKLIQNRLLLSQIQEMCEEMFAEVFYNPLFVLIVIHKMCATLRALSASESNSNKLLLVSQMLNSWDLVNHPAIALSSNEPLYYTHSKRRKLANFLVAMFSTFHSQIVQLLL